jgi:hypothetical protein
LDEIKIVKSKNSNLLSSLLFTQEIITKKQLNELKIKKALANFKKAKSALKAVKYLQK